MTNLIGQSLGRYHILERLGEGGMATVYKALDTGLDRHVAVKVILPYRQHSERFLKRFKIEARALARLSHPNILKIFDYGEHDGSPYLVMEYIPGGTLATKLAGKPLPWQKSAYLVSRIARAIEVAHAQGILHRDVKPSNILITGLGEPLLSDFGIAKLIEGDEETMDLTGSGVGIGTPQYMAPEQGFGKADARSDIYSLGVIFYEMITGHRPYEADTPMAIMLKKNSEPLPRPVQYVPNLPVEVENVLIKALAREPGNRYASMSAFASALEQLVNRKVSHELPDSLATVGQSPDWKISLEQTGSLATVDQEISGAGSTVTGPTVKDDKDGLKKILMIGIAVLAVLCMFGAGFLIWKVLPVLLASTEPGATSLATPDQGILPDTQPHSPIPSDVIPTNTVFFADTPVPAVIPSPTRQPAGGKWIAFNSQRSGNADIYLVDINGNNLAQLTTSPAHDLYPSWSPDGRQIVYQTNEGGDQELAVIDIATKNVRKLTSNGCDDWGPSWSPDGVWIAYYSNCNGERNIYKIRANGDDSQQLTFESGSYNWFPSWSPDGKKITFSSNRSGKYHIYVMNANGNNQQELAQGCVSYFSPDGTRILYGVYCNDTGDLWLVNADGSNQHPVTSDCECKNATWSPDGKSIVFEKSRSVSEGPFAIFIMSLDAPQDYNWIQIVGDDINGRSPVWQP
jgi:serine/threonine protein kinase/Tol biopolymer transport system component